MAIFNTTVDAGWDRYGRGNWKNRLTGELASSYPNAPPPLSQEQIAAFYKKDETINKMRDNILAQGTSDKWTGQGHGSPQANALVMAQSLYNAGITRLEDFGKVPTYEPVVIRNYYNGHELQVTGTDEWGNGGGDYYYREPSGSYDFDGYPESRTVMVPKNATLEPRYFKTVDGGMDGDGNAISALSPLASDDVITKDGQKVYKSGETFGNKVTGKAVPANYDRAGGDIWSGTFAGDGSTGYGVQFNELGMPIFYAAYGGSTSDWGFISQILSIASMIPGPHQPFTMALNAVGNAANGNTVGAILSALGAANAYGQAFNTLPTTLGTQAFDIDTLGDYVAAGVENTAANWLATNAGSITTATQGVQLLNALDKNNLQGIISSLIGISPQIGITIPEDLMRPVQYAAVASALSKGDFAGATYAAATLTNNSNLKLASSGLNLVNALKSGDPTAMLSASIGFAREAQLNGSVIKDAAKQIGIPLTDKRANDLLTASETETETQIKDYFRQVKAIKASYQEQFGTTIPDDLLEAFGNAETYTAGFNNYVTNWNEDRNTTNQTELTSYLSSVGLKIEDLTPDQVFSALSLSEINAKTYAQNLADIKSVTFDGNGYKTKEEAMNAAQKAGYNTFEQNGMAYTFMPGDQAKIVAKAASEGKLPSVSTQDFQTIAGQQFDWVSEKDIPTIVIVAKREAPPLYSDAKAYAEYQQFIKDNGGVKFPKFLSDQLAILTEAFKGAPDGSVANVIKNGLAFGARNFGNLASTLLKGSEAMGLSADNSALKVSQAFERWGKLNQSKGIMDAEKAFSDGLNNISKASLAKELGVPESQVKDWQVAARQLKEFGKQAVNNPLGTLSVVGGEALQEIPFLVASAGVGSIAAKMVSKAGAFAAARGTDAALNGFESFSGNYSEVKQYLIDKGVPPSKAEARALASGLEAMAVTAATSWVGDTAALRVLMGDQSKIAAGLVVGASSKEFVMGYVEGATQNISAQIGKFGEVRNIAEVTASGAMEGFIQSALTTGIVSSQALSQVVAKGYDGASVTLNDIITGAKTFDPSTLIRSAVLAGGITINNALQYNDLSSQGFYASPTQYVDIVNTFQAEGYTPSAAEILKIGNENTDATDAELAAAVTKYADPLNTTKEEAKAFFKEVFGVDPTDAQLTSFIGKSETAAKTLVNEQFGVQTANATAAANTKKATDAGFPDFATYTQYNGDKAAYTAAVTTAANTATATAAGFPDFATYTQYGGNKTAYEAAKVAEANKKTATDAGFPDFATYNQYGGNLAAYNTANTNAANIRTATDAGFPDYATFKQYNGDIAAYTAAKTEEKNKATATAAGFPDFATYTQYNGDKAAYDAAVSTAANTKTATDAGFPDFATYTQYAGDVAAYNTAKTNAANTKTATDAGFPDYAAYTKYNGDIAAYNAATTVAANTKTATDAGFPDYATYMQYGGDKAAYTTAQTNAANTKTATDAGFPDYATYTQYNGDVIAYNTATTTAANTKKATDAGFPDYATYTKYEGNAANYKADLDAKVLGWASAAEQATAKAAGFTDAIAYKNNLATVENTAKATAAGFPDYGTYTQFNGDLAAYNASKLTSDTTTAINNAIAGIKFPAGVSSTDVAAQIKAAMEANPSLSVADVTTAITAYMTANPALTAADVSTAITNATKDFATKKDIETAIAGIKFPTGLTASDVATQIQAALTANPSLKAADVTAAITAYMTANPALTAADVTKSINTATQNLVSQTAFDTAIAGLGTDVKTKFDALSQGQKDIVKAYTQQGVDLNKAITDASVLTAEQINSVKTQLATLTGDVRTKFDALTQGQRDIVNAQIKMGVDINTAISDAARATTQQIAGVKTDLTKNITDVQTQFNARVDELMLQGQTYKAATDTALKELGTGVSGLQTNVTDIQKQLAADAAAKKAAEDKSRTQGGLSAAMQLIAPAAALADTSSPGFKDIGLKTTGEAKFEGPLDQYLKMVKEGDYSPNPTQQETQQQNQQVAPVQDELSTPQQKPEQGSDYFNYGQQTDINDFLGGGQSPTQPFKAGGLATPLFAGGGTTRHGRYAGGGLNIVHHSGKPRLDFRTGNAVTGAGDGQSDDIPAMLADGEFVFPADVVAALGNGSTKAGSDKLYDMMHSIRAYHRSAKPKDLPPPAKKSPLDYLKKPARKARR